MNDVIEKIIEGDVFRWAWLDEKDGDRASWGRYHCKSCIAIARPNGRLYDTYWGDGCQDSLSWSYEDAANQISLTLLGNLSDFEKRPEYDAQYYDRDDCLNLNHSNSPRGNFYVSRNAQRNRERMLEVAVDRVADAEREARAAAERAARFQTVVDALRGGAPLTEVFL